MLLTLLGPWWSELTFLSLSELLYRMGLWTPSYRIVVGMEGSDEPVMGVPINAPPCSKLQCYQVLCLA